MSNDIMTTANRIISAFRNTMLVVLAISLVVLFLV